MSETIYDPESLKQEIKTVEANIARFNEGIQKQLEYKAELMMYLKQAEEA